MNNFSQKYFNKLRVEWRTLLKEKKEAEDILDLAWSEFYPCFLEKLNSEKLDNPFDNLDVKKNQDESSFFQDEDMKTKYRNAAKLTHPDRSNSGSLESFKNISKAKKEGNLNKFYDELRSSNINKGDISFKEIEKMEDEISKLKKEIEDILDSVYLKWFYSNEGGRSIIINSIINNIKNA